MVSEADAVVWVADGEVATGLDWGARIIERLGDRDLRVVRRDLTMGHTTVPSAPLHILSGGATTAREPSGWMARGLALTRFLVDATQQNDQAVVGICLGAQMIGEALWPGSVQLAPEIRVGLTEVDWGGAEDEPLVAPSFHYETLDQRRVVAGGGEVVGRNEREAVQGFRYGTRVWGLQFHPELAPDDVRRLVVHHRQTIESHGGDVDAAIGSVAELEPRWTNRVFERALADVLPDPDRPNGRTK